MNRLMKILLIVYVVLWCYVCCKALERVRSQSVEAQSAGSGRSSLATE